jgi:hypothetical protein
VRGRRGLDRLDWLDRVTSHTPIRALERRERRCENQESLPIDAKRQHARAYHSRQ